MLTQSLYCILKLITLYFEKGLKGPGIKSTGTIIHLSKESRPEKTGHNWGQAPTAGALKGTKIQ